MIINLNNLKNDFFCFFIIFTKMEKYYEYYHHYWRSYYENEKNLKKKTYFYKQPNSNSGEILENDRKIKKILAKARALLKVNKKFKNP